MQNKFLQTLLLATALVVSTGAIAMNGQEDDVPPHPLVSLRKQAKLLATNVRTNLSRSLSSINFLDDLRIHQQEDLSGDQHTKLVALLNFVSPLQNAMDKAIPVIALLENISKTTFDKTGSWTAKKLFPEWIKARGTLLEKMNILEESFHKNEAYEDTLIPSAILDQVKTTLENWKTICLELQAFEKLALDSLPSTDPE